MVIRRLSQQYEPLELFLRHEGRTSGIVDLNSRFAPESA